MRFILIAAALAVLAPNAAHAMCGCMMRPRPPTVGTTTQAKIINRSSKVILAREGDTTVMTLSNDFEGAPADFGLVVPVPSVVKREDVKVVEDDVFAVLETATAPAVTEIFEPDPCGMNERRMASTADAAPAAPAARGGGGVGKRAADYGVKIESHFFAGEYEIAVLSGKDASGLIKWLQLFDYDVPMDAQEVLGTYVKQNMHFFLARVHIKEMGTGTRDLRPIQVRYKTPKLMLPIRLGMVNANGPQELMVFALTPRSRVETTTYRTVRMPSGSALPHFVKDSWSEVYGAMFAEQTRREDMRVVFMEHGAQWTPQQRDAKRAGMFWGDSGYVTRLHFRYDSARFPEDLTLQVTEDSAPFAVRHTAVRPAQNACNHPAPRQAREREKQLLANLTGWSMESVIKRTGGRTDSGADGGDAPMPPAPAEPKWYERLWK